MTHKEFLENIKLWQLQQFHKTLTRRQINNLTTDILVYIGEHYVDFEKMIISSSSNGRTTDFDSVNCGSSPQEETSLTKVNKDNTIA